MVGGTRRAAERRFPHRERGIAALEREEAVSRVKAIVIATTHFNDPKIVAEASETVIGSMKGLAAAAIEEKHLMQTRGW